MTKRLVQLTNDRPSRSVGLDFRAGALFVANFTGSPILVRVGSPEIPNIGNSDYVVPGNGYQTIIVGAREFGLTFMDANLLTTSSAANLGSAATCLFLSEGEQIPNFGAATFQSLSVADLVGGFIDYDSATGIISNWFDIIAWGGALLTIVPSASSGQSILRLEASDDNGVTAYIIQEWACWPNIPVLLTIPRTVRYFRFSLLSTGITGEPNIAGAFALRGTIAEIQQVGYTALGQTITKAYNVPHLGTQTFSFFTNGLPAITVGLNSSTNGSGELIIEASQTLAGTRRVVTFREQVLATSGVYSSIYRGFGPLDRYVHISILDIDVAPGGIAGSLILSILAEPDPTPYLDQIARSLGDPGQPANVNQSIYHQLDTIRLRSIDIDNNTDNIESLLTTTNSLLNLIDSRVDTLEALQTTGNTNTSNTNANVVSAVTQLTLLNSRRTTFSVTFSVVVPATTWVSTAINIPNSWIGKIVLTRNTPATAGAQVAIGLGPFVGVSFAIGNLEVSAFVPTTFDWGMRGGDGYFVSASFPFIWVYSNINCQLNGFVVYEV